MDPLAHADDDRRQRLHRQRRRQRPIRSGEGSLAFRGIAGLTLKTVYFTAIPEGFGLALYLGFGWLGLVSWIALVRRFGFRFARPVLWGALAYTLGALTDYLRWPVPVPGLVGAHELFHLAVLAGLSFHWMLARKYKGGEMTQFVCHGPYKIPTTKQKVGRTISKTNVSEFWSSAAGMANCVGCYVFGVRAGQGMTPLYVGKATKSLAQEAFAPDKLNKYHTGLSQYKKGSPILFFLCHPPSKKGKANLTHIKALERLLIQQGALANPHLMNVHHNKIPKWGISGVMRSTTKKPSSNAKKFRSFMGFAG